MRAHRSRPPLLGPDRPPKRPRPGDGGGGVTRSQPTSCLSSRGLAVSHALSTTRTHRLLGQAVPLLLLIDHDLEPWPRSGLDTRAWWPRGWDVDLLQLGRWKLPELEPPPHPQPGEPGTCSQGWAGPGFPSYFGASETLGFARPAVLGRGCQVRGSRGAGLRPAGLGQSAITVTTVNRRDQRNVHFPSGRPSPGGEAFLATGCTEGKLRPQATSPRCRDLAPGRPQLPGCRPLWDPSPPPQDSIFFSGRPRLLQGTIH